MSGGFIWGGGGADVRNCVRRSRGDPWEYSKPILHYAFCKV